MLKSFLRRWLEIPEATTAKVIAPDPPKPHPTQPPQSGAQEELQRMRGLYQAVSANYQNTLYQVTDLQQKLDVLCEAFGVVIVGGSEGENPKIVSIAENGLLGDAKSYINAAQVIDKAANMHLEFLKNQAKFYGQLEADRAQRKQKVAAMNKRAP